jgi:hypothetical protein
MQQRRGTASQWTSANPVLNAGEIGWESDTNRFKIGDGTNHWADIDYFADINSTVNPAFGSSIVFEGATADSYETTIQVTDPTADRTITIPDVTGTVITTGNLSDITNIGVFTSTITMEGSTANDFELTLSAGDPTADRTVTFPDATGTVALTSDITVTASSTNTFSNKSISLGSNTVTSTLAELNAAVSDADVATLAGTETLTNKTLTTPTINGPTITATGQTPTIHGIYLPAPHNIIFEGATADDFETTLEAGEPTGDRTITLPDASGTVALVANVAALSGATFTGAVSGTDLTLSGNLTVNGTTTNINSTNLVVEDKNIVLADVASPTDTTADGGGITLKGATDKTFNWVDATDSWTSSEHINLASGKSYYMNGTLLKDVSETLTNKTLTSPIITGLTLNDSSIVFEGATADSFETTLTVTDPTADRTLTLPDATGTLLSTALFSAKGSILIGTGSGTLTAQSVGANGSVLTADSNEADGVKWVAASGGAAFNEFMLIGA